MCGRFTHLFSWAELYRLLALSPSSAVLDVEPRYNVAPTQSVPIVKLDSEGKRVAAPMRWGLIPSWADDPSIGNRLINARSEEAAAKPSFRAAWKKRRCLVPVSGFYEWQAIEGQKAKQPWYFTVLDTPLFCFAGLWEFWDKGGEPLESFTILTGAPNEMIAKLHHRMPCIVPPEKYAAWLDPAATDVASLLRPFPAESMGAQKVSTRVNAPKNDGPDLIEALHDPGI